jgi:hypothetical protein
MTRAPATPPHGKPHALARTPVVLSPIPLVLAVLVALVATPVTAPPQSDEVVALNDRAKALIAEGEHEEAVAVLDEAIEIDDSYWELWYQRGRALALLERYEEATESLLESTTLNPGHANAHMLTAHAAMYAGDMDLAWEQGIRAYLAGEDPQQIFGGLSTRSEPPADFDERIAAWRVFVAGIDTRDLLASAQGPANTRGGAVGLQEELVQLQPDLSRLQRHLANAISAATGFGLVPQVELAQYYMTISPDEIGTTPRPSMEGYVRLYSVESEDAVYSRRVEFRDLSSTGQVRATLQNVINQLENWRREQQQAP